jgi:prophage regulatory protein
MDQTRLIRIAEVESLVGLRKSSIYKFMQRGEFPRPVVLGRRSVRWRACDVHAWIAERSSVAAA